MSQFTGSRSSRYESMKRIFDIILSIMLLVLLSPVFFMVAIVLRWKMGSPIIFRQTRPGLDGRPFVILKFRTMCNIKNSAGNLAADEKRISSFGFFLRATSLDELPELLNVLKGDMSIVGPRPLLMEYLPLYSPEQARRHEVRPGLTGWAQINGRNALSWEEKFDHDLWYVDNRSFLLDLKIIWMSFLPVVLRRGVSSEGAATMPKFTGQRQQQ